MKQTLYVDVLRHLLSLGKIHGGSVVGTALQFATSINAAGAVAAGNIGLNIPSDKYFVPDEIRAYMSNGPINPNNIALMQFNIQEGGSQRWMFPAALSFGNIIDSWGAQTPLAFPVLEIFGPSAIINVQIAVRNAALWIAAAQNDVGITLVGNYIDAKFFAGVLAAATAEGK